MPLGLSGGLLAAYLDGLMAELVVATLNGLSCVRNWKVLNSLVRIGLTHWFGLQGLQWVEVEAGFRVAARRAHGGLE